MALDHQVSPSKLAESVSSTCTPESMTTGAVFTRFSANVTEVSMSISLGRRLPHDAAGCAEQLLEDAVAGVAIGLVVIALPDCDEVAAGETRQIRVVLVVDGRGVRWPFVRLGLICIELAC